MGSFTKFKSNTSPNGSCVLVVLVLLSFGLWSCGPSDDVEKRTPEISFVGYEVLKDLDQKDSLLILTISYADDDGDIGLTDADTFPPFNGGSPFNNNLFISIKERKGSGYQDIYFPGTSDTTDFNQRIPNLTPTGKNKKISGFIDIRLDATPNYLYPDTIECFMQIADRDLNVSNKIMTGPIYLQH
ncbi:MAG: hypothetical protein ACI8ZN_000053 [Bacteroidia bacterium]|jgi:hypothetical protein